MNPMQAQNIGVGGKNHGYRTEENENALELENSCGYCGKDIRNKKKKYYSLDSQICCCSKKCLDKAIKSVG